MIHSEHHAIAVQARRAKSGKRGVSKAVRRYMKANNRFFLRETMNVIWAKAWSAPNV